MSSAFTRVAVVQLEYHPAIVQQRRSPLEDPGGIEAILPGSARVAESLIKPLDQLRRCIRSLYTKSLFQRIEAILAACHNWGVRIAVFPEYSIPWDILDDVAKTAKDIVVVAGTHMVELEGLDTGVYERLGWSSESLETGQAIAPVLHGGRITALSPKFHNATAVREEIVPGTSWAPVEMPQGIIGPMGVMVCLDFLYRENPEYEALISKPLKRCSFLAVPSLTGKHSVGEFGARAWEEARRYGRPVLYTNRATGGGTSIFVDEERESNLRPFPEHVGQLDAGDEGVIIADVDLGFVRSGGSTRYSATTPVRPFASATFVYRSRPNDDAYATWLKDAEALLAADGTGALRNLRMHIEANVEMLRDTTSQGRSATRNERLSQLCRDIRHVTKIEEIRQLTREVVLPAETLPFDVVQAALAKGTADVMESWLREHPTLGQHLVDLQAAARKLEGIHLTTAGRASLGTLLTRMREANGIASVADQPLSESERVINALRESLKKAERFWEPEVGFSAVSTQGTLNFEDGYHPLVIRRGEERVASADALRGPVMSERCIVVSGGGGAGKTTWLRWVCRNFLENRDFLPVHIRLSEVAFGWQDPTCTGDSRSLDAYLENWGSQFVPAWKSTWIDIFRSPDSPTPLLLLDAWDEMGALGTEFVEKLSRFCESYPRVRIIMTSRFDGAATPRELRRFAIFEMQALAQSELEDFVSRAMRSLRGSATADVESEKQKFLRALRASPEAMKLAETPLLLTLMVGLHKTHGILDKRHRLYERCIDQLLIARPHRKTEAGAQPRTDTWCPDDVDECHRVVAELAARLHAKLDAAEGKLPHSAVSGEVTELSSLLPANWPDIVPAGFTRDTARTGFIRWLARSAGILTRSNDNGYAISNVAFQDYLTAWHLDRREPLEVRADAFTEKAVYACWWDVLVLWASIMHSDNPTRVNPIIDALLKEPRMEHTAFVGALFASGMGDEAQFRQWLQHAERLVGAELKPHVGLCATSWATTRQEARRYALASRFADLAKSQRIHHRIYTERMAEACGFPALQPPPRPGSLAADVINAIRANHFDTPRMVIAARILCKNDTQFDAFHLIPEIALLSALWPSKRVRVGYALQLLMALGATQSEMRQHASILLRNYPDIPPELSFEGEELASLLMESRIGAEKWNTAALAPVTAAILEMSNARFGDSQDYVRAAMSILDSKPSRSSDSIGSKLKNATRMALEWGQAAIQGNISTLMTTKIERWLVDTFQLESSSPWLLDFAMALVLSPFVVGLRPRILFGWTCNNAAIACVLSAYHLTITPADNTKIDQFVEELQRRESRSDPFWIALARHIVGRSTVTDRAVLVELASHPEKRPGVLSLALRHIVRGDICQEDGTVISLDELATELSLEPLPFLEDAPARILPSTEQLEQARPIAERKIRTREFVENWVRSTPKWSFEP